MPAIELLAELQLAKERIAVMEAEVSRLGTRLEGAYLRAERAEAALAEMTADRDEWKAQRLEYSSELHKLTTLLKQLPYEVGVDCGCFTELRRVIGEAGYHA